MRYIGHGLVFLVLFALGAVAGDIVVDGAFKSTQATGPPLEVASSDMVMNLNADQVDGIEGAELYTRAEVDVLLAGARAADHRRRYYLTTASHKADLAPTACATGFHFANLYELSQPSNLQYAYDHPDAYTTEDSGKGPQTEFHGYVRTGNTLGFTDDGPGRANCNLWTSYDPTHEGTVARLPENWADPASGAGSPALVWGTPWLVYTAACSSGRQWCVED
jgi:hypothetical protein